MDEAAERELVERARRGEWSAFDTLVEGHQRRVYGLAYRLTDSHDDADAITQDVFIQAYQSFGQFGGRSRFMTWLYTITLHRVLDRRRRLKGGPRTFSLEDGPDVASDGRRDAPGGPPEGLRLTELHQMLREALGKISLEKRAALTLVVQHGYAYREAARILGCPKGTVAWRVWDARRRLREMVGCRLRRGDV